MKINIVAVGKIKEKYIKMGINEFLKRLTRYSKVKVIEVSDEKIPPNASDADIEALKDREADKILNKIPDYSYLIVLDIKGKSLSSEQLAKKMSGLMLRGKSNITFVIGGAMGLHRKIISKADLTFSFSRLTFTHQMIRMILLEQIYRAFKIIKGEPYHH